jgi:hypothetical protein
MNQHFLRLDIWSVSVVASGVPDSCLGRYWRCLQRWPRIFFSLVGGRSGHFRWGNEHIVRHCIRLKKRWHSVSAVETFRIFAKSHRKSCRHFHVSYRFTVGTARRCIDALISRYFRPPGYTTFLENSIGRWNPDCLQGPGFLFDLASASRLNDALSVRHPRRLMTTAR